jgi:hypothetical protein
LTTLTFLRTLNLDLKSGIISDGAFFTTLAIAMQAFPLLLEFKFNCSSNQIGQEAKKKNPDYKLNYDYKTLCN